MLSRTASAALLLLMALPALGQEQKEIEREVRQRYEGKTVYFKYVRRIGDYEFLLPKEERKTIEPGGKAYLNVTEVKLKKNEIELRGRRLVPYVDAERRRVFAAGRPGVYRLQWRGRADLHQARTTLSQLLTAMPSPDAPWLGPGREAENQGEKQQGRWYDDSLAASAKRIGGDVSPPVCILCPQPEYPAEVRRAKVEGVVVLHVIISEIGQAHAIRVSRSVNPQLDAAAAFSVGRWKFKPATKDGKPLVVSMTIEVDFHLY